MIVIISSIIAVILSFSYVASEKANDGKAETIVILLIIGFLLFVVGYILFMIVSN